jgi:hypothetical protein
LAKLFIEGIDISDKTQSKYGQLNINDILTEGNFFLQTSDTSNMPNDYKNEWVWLSVKRSNNRILQVMAPDNENSGWLCIRTISTDIKPYVYSNWNVIDFVKGKILQIGG